MAVSINSIGNYSAYTNVTKTKTETTSSSAEKPQKISNEEKKFFAKMYPTKQTEIMEYYYYEKSGKMNGIAVGTKIDRRG